MSNRVGSSVMIISGSYIYIATRNKNTHTHIKTRPHTRLPKSRAGGQGQSRNRPTKLLGRSSNPKTAHECQKSKVVWMDGWTERRTERAVESRARD